MIEAMEKPFAMFELEKLELERDNAINDTVAPHGFEKSISDQIHKLTSNTPWVEILLVSLLVYSFFTCLVCFFRPDFLDLVNCCGGIYLIVYITRATNRDYRYYFFSLLSTLLFDLLFLLFLAAAWWADQHFDGEMEAGMRRYSIVISVVLIFIKIPIVIIFWHTSVHYFELIQPIIDKIRRLSRYGNVNFGTSGGFGLGYSYLLNNKMPATNNGMNPNDPNYYNQYNGNYNNNRGFDGPNSNGGNMNTQDYDRQSENRMRNNTDDRRL